MAIKVSVKPIKPKLIPGKKILPELNKVMVKEGKSNRQSLGLTTKTWQNEKPTFKTTRTASRDEITVATLASGSGLGVKKWVWLNIGTEVRRAKMSSDFSPKTRPGRLTAKGGSGRRVMVSRAFNFKGIEPRRWSQIIETKRLPIFTRNVNDVIRKYAIFGG